MQTTILTALSIAVSAQIKVGKSVDLIKRKFITRMSRIDPKIGLTLQEWTIQMGSIES